MTKSEKFKIVAEVAKELAKLLTKTSYANNEDLFKIVDKIVEKFGIDNETAVAIVFKTAYNIF